jgi:hypothetical protein
MPLFLCVPRVRQLRSDSNMQYPRRSRRAKKLSPASQRYQAARKFRNAELNTFRIWIDHLYQ